ncbi:uncharacterized protein LOC124926496 [Impatiens glandulifera]|uniref:uncharacterized protein LOC124926496 n=1 Tax=Impatiens glandulifera TaxID=253017 RepID=UPI001FB14706|nr:uncharacterized protein LOC124926496 [Impatiens glandulifera]XP_047322687.1 uncharacterized protein LOC124926496 [Impatiens glandulifera]XP_047322688.1 uncharacterized protein LOC124926496 [Impatiens glandulifera]
MLHTQVLQLCVTLFILGGWPLNVALVVESKTLNVGEELWKEILPLQMSSRLYNLKGLKSNTWYEVKISYPASIPSRFSLQLKKGNSELGLNHKRKLLNTEKLIFKTDNIDLLNNQEEIYVLVIVEPEGVVAMTHVSERKEVIFNIVCDELLLGIPQHAWLVAFFVLICLGLAMMLPIFLPSYLLRENGRLSQNQNASKNS